VVENCAVDDYHKREYIAEIELLRAEIEALKLEIKMYEQRFAELAK
jgi:hypothetical protein